MYGYVGIFFVYLYCLDNFLGNWLTSIYNAVSGLADSLGMVSLSYTIDAMAHKSLNGTGFFITAIVFTVLTSCIVGSKSIEAADAS